MAVEIKRTVGLVVDTGIHAFNWPRNRAIEFMSTYTTGNSVECAVNLVPEILKFEKIDKILFIYSKNTPTRGKILKILFTN